VSPQSLLLIDFSKIIPEQTISFNLVVEATSVYKTLLYPTPGLFLNYVGDTKMRINIYD